MIVKRHVGEWFGVSILCSMGRLYCTRRLSGSTMNIPHEVMKFVSLGRRQTFASLVEIRGYQGRTRL